MSLRTATTGTRNTEPLILAVEGTAANLVNEVIEGAVVKAVYIELWTLGSSNDGSQIVTLSKNGNGVTGPSFTQMAALGTYVEKKGILFTHQGLSANDGVGNPVMIMRGWYKIPKSKQRFGLGDGLHLCVANPSANTLTYCGFATYKEYT